MGSSVRPLAIQKKFDELYCNLDKNEIEKAKKDLSELKAKIDVNDPELTSCTIKIKLAERKLNK